MYKPGTASRTRATLRRASTPSTERDRDMNPYMTTAVPDAAMYGHRHTPEVPHRHPARLASVEETGTRGAHGLNDEQLDLWEQAAILHHNGNWGDSAELFLKLSKIIHDDLDSTLCLLNAGIIHSRLGNFKLASETLDQAARVDETLALTLLIMGNVEFNLRNIAKAKDCWQIALNSLDEQSQNYAHLGLDFELNPIDVEYNLDLLWSKQDHAAKAASLVGLPNKDVFEAPSKLPLGDGCSMHSKSKSSSSASRSSIELGITALPVLSETGVPIESPPESRSALKSVEYAREEVVLHPPVERGPVIRRPATSKARSSSTFGNFMRSWSAQRRQSAALRYGGSYDWSFPQEVEKDLKGKVQPAAPIPVQPAGMRPIPVKSLSNHRAAVAEKAAVDKVVLGQAAVDKAASGQSTHSRLTKKILPPTIREIPVLDVPKKNLIPAAGEIPPPPRTTQPLTGNVEVVSQQEIADFFRRAHDTSPTPRQSSPAPRQSSPTPRQTIVRDEVDDDASVYSDDEDSSRHDSMVSDESPGGKNPTTPTFPTQQYSTQQYPGQSYSDTLRSAFSTPLPTHLRPEPKETVTLALDPYHTPYAQEVGQQMYALPSISHPPVPARSASRRKVPMLPRIHELDPYSPRAHTAMVHPGFYQEGGMF